MSLTNVNIIEKMLGAKEKPYTTTLFDGEWGIEKKTSLDSLFIPNKDASLDDDPDNRQDLFKCSISLNKTTFFPGEILNITANLESLVEDPVSVPMAFGVFVQIPSGEIITALPVPESNPGMRIAVADPVGNDQEWEFDHIYNDSVTSNIWNDTTWGGQITPLTFAESYPYGIYKIMLMAFLVWEGELYAISWDQKNVSYSQVVQEAILYLHWTDQ